mmetsp:Transcript_20712/g.44151  ORF Transcript_20712/g.44151 Transcript_20712/m.44151 type:complete len:212 (-) Transcript_20712:271-906(-)
MRFDWLLPLQLLFVSPTPLVIAILPAPLLSPPPVTSAKFFFCGQESATGARQLDEEGGGRTILSMPKALRRSSRSSPCKTSWRASLLSRSFFTECVSFEMRSAMAWRSSRAEVLKETCFAMSSCFIPIARMSPWSWPKLSSMPRITSSIPSICSSKRFTVLVVASRVRCIMHLASFCNPRPLRRIDKYLLVRSTSSRTSNISMLSLCAVRW